jgi:hypothetical protein
MADPYEGLDPTFAARLKKMVADSGGRITLGSGYRSVERQEELWDQAVDKYGSEEAAKKWVARPGKSNHNHGLAGDLNFTADGQEWAHQNAARYGLWFPMSHEPWHIEAIKTAHGDDFNPEAYTPAPLGSPPVGDPSDPGFQFTRMLSILDGEVQAGIAGTPLDQLGLGAGAGDQLGVGSGGPTGARLDSGAAMPALGLTETVDAEEELMDELEREAR